MASLLLVSGCGGGGQDNARDRAGAAPGGTVGAPVVEAALKRRGGDILLFVARPTRTVRLTVASLERTMKVMRARLDAVGMKDAGIVREGVKIKILLPDGPAVQEARRVVGTPGRLVFYD